MEVGVHEAVRMDAPIRALRRARRTGDQRASIVVVDDNASAGVASGKDVLDRACCVETGLAWHRVMVTMWPPVRQMAPRGASFADDDPKTGSG